jgi:hypothetical protein
LSSLSAVAVAVGIALAITIRLRPFCQSLSSLAQAFASLWIKEGTLSVDSSTLSFSQSHIITARHSLVDHDSVVPERDGAWSPLPSHSQIISIEQMFTEKGEDVIRLLTSELFNSLNKRWIVVQRF